MGMDKKSLKAMLTEDTGSEEMADGLLPHVEALKRWPTPDHAPAEIQALLQVLSAEMPNSNRRLNLRWIGLILWAQVRIIGTALWGASALVMVMGTLVTLVTYQPGTDQFAPLVILAPIITALGVGLLYDTERELQFEIEDATPLGVMFLLLARLVLIFGFNLGLALLGSVVLAVGRADISLTPLLLAWLLPMTFLSALAFFLSVALRSAALSIAVSLVIWSLHVFLTASGEVSALFYVLSMPGLSDESTRPLLLLASILGIGAAFLTLQTTDRNVRMAE